MCGRFTLHTEKEALAERFELDVAQLAALAPHYNIAPTQDVLAIRADRRSPRRLAALVRWGLVPSWSKAIGAQALMINARVESLAEKPAFARSLESQRCLIPADGFYEWQAAGSRARTKQPHLVARNDGEPFAMAGLFARWHPPGTEGGEALVSCAIITTAAVGELRALHDRMPVILPREAEARWLDPTLDGDTAALLALLQPVPAAELHTQPVSRRVNDVANDDPELLKRDESEPSLGLF